MNPIYVYRISILNVYKYCILYIISIPYTYRVSVYMGSSYCCIVACTHLENSTSHKTVTLAAALLLTSGPVRY